MLKLKNSSALDQFIAARREMLAATSKEEAAAPVVSVSAHFKETAKRTPANTETAPVQKRRAGYHR